MHQCTHLLGLAIDNWGWFESLDYMIHEVVYPFDYKQN